MKYKRTNKFSELDYSGNWAGLGKDLFRKIEAGKTVTIEKPPKKLVDGEFIKKIEENKKTGVSNGN